MSLSDNLRALRKQKGYSQEQLAERLNVSRQAVSKWESDNGYPEMESLIILSDLFECCLLYTSPSPRDRQKSRMPSSA